MVSSALGANGGEVTDGQSFVDALGGSECAEYRVEDGVTIVTLKSDVEPVGVIEIQSGSYVLQGSGTIGRTEAYKGTIINIKSGAALTLGGDVVLDGGAVWTGAETPADGASNAGFSVNAPLIRNSGTFKLTGNAVIQNQAEDAGSRNGAIHSNGSVSIEGGTIRNCGGGYGCAVYCENSAFSMSGGTLSGNRGGDGDFYPGSVVHSYYSGGSMIISGGEARNNKAGGVFYAENADFTVSGGTFENNDAIVALGSANCFSVNIEGGTFRNNKQAAHTYFTTYTTNRHLVISGDPVFETANDFVEGYVWIEGDFAADAVYIRPPSFDIGFQALHGTSELIAANYQKFTLVGTNDTTLVITSEGRIDTDPTSYITDGKSFVAALGGAAYASWARNPSTGVYTITLRGDAKRSREMLIYSGSYILQGSGSVSRAEGYRGTVMTVGSGTEVTLSGNVVFDGGAVWSGAATPAEGAENTGITVSAPLIKNSGTFKLTGNAVIQNQAEDAGSRNGAIHSSGSVSIEGGTIRNCGGGYGCAVYCDNSAFSMSGGTLSGNRGGDGDFYPGSVIHSYYSGGTMAISGGEARNNKAGGVFCSEHAGFTVSGGTFENNDAIAAKGYLNCGFINISGGTFRNNKQAVYGYYDSDVRNCSITLSGNPVFETATDYVEGYVQIGEGFASNAICIRPPSFDIGFQALHGTSELIAANYQKFTLVGTNDTTLVITSEGRIDTDPTSYITDGKSFVEALGGAAYATWIRNPSTGVYTITLRGDAKRSREMLIYSGSYILQGSGSVSRAEGYRGTV
ncbi:MAG: hypothetical protein IIY29_02235, partial [Firmicutes bacterium]|nr:hypothetical protein [Bacillota bacterium]